jgi:hypothetical protein
MSSVHPDVLTTAGPWLLFIGTDAVCNLWKVSVLCVTDKTEPPSITLSGGSVTAVVLVKSIGTNNFWRASFETVIAASATNISYTIDGATYAYAVPAQNDTPTILYTSCNGFDLGTQVKAKKEHITISHTWKNVVATHKTSPFHVGLGGGDQLYCDNLTDLPCFKAWYKLAEDDLNGMYATAFSPEMSTAVADYFLANYLTQFTTLGYAEALASIPMINIWDDHDIFDGWGSYENEFQQCPVLQGIMALAREYYWLFQHHMDISHNNNADEAVARGYFNSITSSSIKVAGDVAILALDGRSERTRSLVNSTATYDLAFAKAVEICSSPDSKVKHMVVMIGVPIIYPNMHAVLHALGLVYKPKTQLLAEKLKTRDAKKKRYDSLFLTMLQICNKLIIIITATNIIPVNFIAAVRPLTSLWPTASPAADSGSAPVLVCGIALEPLILLTMCSTIGMGSTRTKKICFFPDLLNYQRSIKCV